MDPTKSYCTCVKLGECNFPSSRWRLDQVPLLFRIPIKPTFFCCGISYPGTSCFRRQAFWVAKQLLQLGMGDAFDDWLIEKIQLLRNGPVIASGIQRIEQVKHLCHINSLSFLVYILNPSLFQVINLLLRNSIIVVEVLFSVSNKSIRGLQFVFFKVFLIV